MVSSSSSPSPPASPSLRSRQITPIRHRPSQLDAFLSPVQVQPSSATSSITPSSSTATLVPLPTVPPVFPLPSSQNGIEKDLANAFPAFGHQEILATPYEAELKRDEEFQAQLHQMLLDLILEFHAWATSKPENETVTVGEALFEETQAILQREQEQGMCTFSFESTRLRLLEFITKIKTALAALTSFL